MNVVRAVEDAVDPEKPFDYIFVCVKALPDVYDLASVIEAVVTPSHTCILLNTTNTIGIERLLEERFPKNLVLSVPQISNIQNHQKSGLVPLEKVWLFPLKPNRI